MSSAPATCPTFDQVVSAARRIESGIVRTPCVRSAALSELCRAEIWCKLDYLQSTGSFKERGGRNALLQLDAAARAKGVIAASAGNHALALAYHGRSLGIPVTVVLPFPHCICATLSVCPVDPAFPQCICVTPCPGRNAAVCSACKASALPRAWRTCSRAWPGNPLRT
jgi:hypothetical protein